MSYQPGGLVLPDLSRRGYLSKNASSSNRFGLVNGDGLSKDSRCWCTFSRWRSSMDNAIACSSSLVIVCTGSNLPEYLTLRQKCFIVATCVIIQVSLERTV